MSTLSPTSANSSAGPSNTQRNPPPTLFQAPNTSNISLSSPSAAGTTQRAPLLRSRSARGPEAPSLSHARTQGPQPAAPTGVGQREDNRVDAEWAKMQLTLEEVELSALSSTHVFGSAHNAALEELREAQMALARAWGRGEADEDFLAADGEDEERKNSESSKAKDEGKEKEEGGDEGDVAEAKRRREANERFFKKVSEGVEDVVGKLEGVAAAMAKVERQSREIWDESDIEGESIAS